MSASFQFRWDIFFESIFYPDSQIVHGLYLTVSVATTAMLLGIMVGIFLALAKISRFPLLSWPAILYIWVMRGSPLLVQIMLLYFGLGVAKIYSWPTIELFGISIPGNIQAGIVALGINEGAYMAEIIRAGILSIDPGQQEAAKSLGMTYGLTMRRIILPQAARVIIPPLGNNFNGMLKTTSLLVVISVPELFVIFTFKNASGPAVFRPFELFLAAGVWYLVLTSSWAVVQAKLERHFGRGTREASSHDLLTRLFSLHFARAPRIQPRGDR